MNTFLRATHSALHFVQSLSSWAISSADMRGVPARRGCRYSRVFSIYMAICVRPHSIYPVTLAYRSFRLYDSLSKLFIGWSTLCFCKLWTSCEKFCAVTEHKLYTPVDAAFTSAASTLLSSSSVLSSSSKDESLSDGTLSRFD